VSKKKKAFCPACGQRIYRSIVSMKRHHLNVHKETLTDGEAYKMVTEIGASGLLSYFR